MVKRRKIFSSYLVTFPNYSLRTFQRKKKRFRSGQVTRAGLLTPPKKSLQSRQCFSWNDFHSSGIHYRTSMCNLYISELVYLWPEVRSESWPLYCKDMGIYSNVSCFEQTSQSHPIISWFCQIISPVTSQVSFTDRCTGKSHLRSCEVINRFSQQIPTWWC